MIIGLRVSGLMLFAPFFGNAVIPPRIKAVLVIAITAVLYPVFAPQLRSLGLVEVADHRRHRNGSRSRDRGSDVCGIRSGADRGADAQHPDGLFAGQYSGPQYPGRKHSGRFFSPEHGDVDFSFLECHHWILRAVANSFEYLPPGTVTAESNVRQAVLHEGAIVLELGVQIAAPVLAATLLMDLILGLLGKASPQMPLMLLGPAVKSMLGVLAS